MFYILCGLIAALTQAFLNPTSAVPMVGASGAIGGVMGAYIVLYPRVQIHMLIFLFVFVTRIVVPAYWMLGYWFLMQVFSGYGSIGADRGGVAFWAHVGGFAAGALLVMAVPQAGAGGGASREPAELCAGAVSGHGVRA